MGMNLTWEELVDSQEYIDLCAELASKKEGLCRRINGALSRKREAGCAEADDVDLIFQGGGMLGLAHLGVLDALEQIGLRARNVAGTSAGAIMATLVYAHLREDDRRRVAGRVFEDMREMPLSRMMDGPSALRRWFEMRRADGFLRLAANVFRGVLPAAKALRRNYGMHPGNVFSAWLDERLSLCGIHTLAELCSVSSGRVLKTVACGIPGGIKFVFPDMLEQLNVSPENERPSLMARASMAIPLVYEPVQLPTDPSLWGSFVRRDLASSFAGKRVEELASARRILLFDGGLFSNLPVDILSEPPGPWAPTIAVALHSTKKRSRHVALRRRAGSLVGFMADLLEAARGLRDREARQSRSRTGDFLVLWVDTEEAHWLDFSGNPAVAKDLFFFGMKSVLEWKP